MKPITKPLWQVRDEQRRAAERKRLADKERARLAAFGCLSAPISKSSALWQRDEDRRRASERKRLASEEMDRLAAYGHLSAPMGLPELDKARGPVRSKPTMGRPTAGPALEIVGVIGATESYESYAAVRRVDVSSLTRGSMGHRLNLPGDHPNMVRDHSEPSPPAGASPRAPPPPPPPEPPSSPSYAPAPPRAPSWASSSESSESESSEDHSEESEPTSSPVAPSPMARLRLASRALYPPAISGNLGQSRALYPAISGNLEQSRALYPAIYPPPPNPFEGADAAEQAPPLMKLVRLIARELELEDLLPVVPNVLSEANVRMGLSHSASRLSPADQANALLDALGKPSRQARS